MQAILGPLYEQGCRRRVLEAPLCAPQLSHIGPLADWSVGGGGALVRTDLTTCQMHSSTNSRRVTNLLFILFFRLGDACDGV
jgi:hypothetical protein